MVCNTSSFLLLILSLALQFDFSVTSWIRTPKRNQAVGGSKESWHLTGLAVDVVLDDSSLRDSLVAKCHRLGLKCLDEGDHLHIQI